MTRRTAAPPTPRDDAALRRRWLEWLPMPAFLADRDGRIAAWNARALEVWGTAPDPAAEPGNFGPVTVLRADGSPDPDTACWLLRCMSEECDVRSDELRLRRADGSQLEVQAHATPLRDREGRVEGAVCVLLDITARRRAERLQQEHTRLLELIATGQPLERCLQALCEATGRQHPGTRSGVAWLDATREQFERMTVDGLPPAFAAAFVGAFPAAATSGPIGAAVHEGEPVASAAVASDARWPAPFRELCAAHGVAALHAFPVYESSGRSVACFFLAFERPRAPDGWETRLGELGARLAGIAIERDRAQRAVVESRARLKEELADSHLLHRISLEMTSQNEVQALYGKIVDAAMQLLHAPVAGMQRLRHERSEAAVLDLIAVRGLPPELAARWQQVGPDAPSLCAGAWRRGERLVVPDVGADDALDEAERQAYLLAGLRALQCTPLRSRSGRVLGMLSTCWREPHRPAAHDLRLLDVLARQAADLIERSEAEEALREAGRSKDQFLAQLAHELRNPLAPIRNAVQLLRQRGGDAPELRWSRDVIDRQVSHLTRLIDDLLDVSRITRNRLELRTQRVDLAEIVRAAVETARPLLEQKSQRLDVRLPEEPILLDADLVRLAQVFTNLLTNACKYSDPDSTVLLQARRERARTSPGEVVVRVQDRGVGLTPEQQARVFDLFYQADRTLERSQGGLGIGLSLARRLVELHGGTIQVRSDGPGRGSEFLVRLPVAEAPAAAEGRGDAPLAEVSDRKRRRILVVDDNREIAESLAVLLRTLGHEVETAFDGEEGLRIAERMRPDAVLLDLSMPRMDGYDACRRMRRAPWGRNLLLVAVSAWGQHEDRARGIEAGFDFHMTKPADPAAIASLIDALGE